MQSNHPIFIGGMYKSGTSLLRAMLGHHSHLFAGLETQWINERWNDANAEQARREWLRRLAVFFDAPVEELEAACGEATDVETCLDRVLSFLAARAGKARWIEKTPGNAGAIDRILAHWPDARILHIVRDPRDVYASMIESRKWTVPQDFAQRWTGIVAAARNWLKRHGGTHPAYYELRYERLVRSPESETRKILEFLGEPFEDGVAEFLGQSEDFEIVRRATGKESPTLQRLAGPITTSRVGVWKDVVSPKQWRAVEAELRRDGSGSLVDELIADGDASGEETGRGRAVAEADRR